jgi:hypothetical protein
VHEEWLTYFADGAVRQAVDIAGGWKGEVPGHAYDMAILTGLQVLYTRTLRPLTLQQHTTFLLSRTLTWGGSMAEHP